ncbi:MAG: hypothetical protein M3Q95_10290 [Bacteroidota bacterium]|nr:hypothetical protein [Bacteroidota bacterium]
MNTRSIRKYLLQVTFIIAIPLNVSAQEITMEHTLAYINGKLGAGYEVDVNKGVIVARFSEGSEVYREDQVLYKSLDLSSMKYDPSQRLFIINCKGTSKCVDRQLFIRKEQRDYSRISFPVTLDAKGVEGMKKAFTHMIRLIEDIKYSSSEPFE